MPSERPPDGVARRLHPVSLFFSLGGHVRAYVVPALLVLFLSRGEPWQRWLIIPFFGVVIVELMKYVSLTYRLDAHELVITQGLLSRRERHIPYARIQNIEVVQNALHRLLGVGDVRLDTGSGSEAEAHLQVVSLSAANELRRRVLEGRQLPDERVHTTALLRLRLADLALHGIVTSRGTVVLAAIAGMLWELNVDTNRILEYLPGLREWWGAMGGLSRRGILLSAVLVVLLALLFRLLSAAWSAVRLAGFTLSRREDELQVQYGLLTRVATTIPRERIQTLVISDGPWHRLFGRTTVRVETAGRFAHDEVSSGSHLLAPVVRQESLAELVREVLPEGDIEAVTWQRIDPRTFRRLLRPRLPLALAFGAAVAPAAGWWSAVAVGVFALLFAYDAWVTARWTAYALTPAALLVRSGAWTRRTSVARFARVQSMALRQSPFDRRWRMARLHFDTAGGSSLGRRLVIPWLPQETAEALYTDLRVRIAGSAAEAPEPAPGTVPGGIAPAPSAS
ncbi:MAG TPA: PH domain-containing protein [Vicinamibacterales bacterium]